MIATKKIRRALELTSLATLIAIGLAGTAHAQAQADDPAIAEEAATAADATDNVGITVTGSRIKTSGFTAPTPTTVIGAEQIAANAQPNIFNTIQQLPSLQGSTGTTVNTFSTSSGQQGLSSFSLRGLGIIRTLTLLDGQRVVPANVIGVPDISMFPQLLIQRVDVVNGGASASYGSDAVGGVVNFITDTKFEGIKGNIQTGITRYGDDEQALVQIAVGKSFGRFHAIGSFEYDHEGGVGAGNFGTDLAGSRDWYRATTLVDSGVQNSTNPQFLYRDFGQPYQYSKWGLINNGPLQGTAFNEAGQPYNFAYGSNGVPNKTGGVTGCYVGFCVGGDMSGHVGSGASLRSSLERINGYTRLSYEIGDNSEFYVTANVARVKTNNQPNPGANRTNITVQCSNPYLPQSVATACAANNITSFSYGLSNAILPNIQVFTDRAQYRGVAGLKGTFGDSGWSYDAYYEHGLTISDVTVENIMLNRRYDQAADAALVGGEIVCRNATARANGCLPINIFGNNAISLPALRYIIPENGPFQHTRLTQDVASAYISGSPFSLWAGPLSIAVGGEYRREAYRVNADAYGNGVTAISPNNADYPADPILSAAGTNWFAGNYRNGNGKFDVIEGSAEVNVPLLDSDVLGKANLNGAARVTKYSTSGTVWTWKVGGTWDTPLDGFRLRGVTSRDVRAPNLSELFAAPVATTVPNFTYPAHAGPNGTTIPATQVSIFQNAIGNVDLKPEIARNTEVGAVLSRPSWLPGLNLSVDYYKIKLNGGIASLTAQQIVNFCLVELRPATCGAFDLDSTTLKFVNVQPFNLASIKTSGLDIEASYQWQNPLSLGGSLTLRALATHVIKFVTDTGIPRVAPVDTAGNNAGATPNWKWLAVQSYDNDAFNFSVTERWFSNGTFGNQYVVCAAGSCPNSTTDHPTIDRNFMKGAFYLDIGGAVKINEAARVYFKVDNLLNEKPEAAPQTNTGLDVNPALYDTFGTVYRLGMRFSF